MLWLITMIKIASQEIQLKLLWKHKFWKSLKCKDIWDANNLEILIKGQAA